MDLRWFYDDRCCNGSKNPAQHFLAGLFPAVARAPLSDGFHSVQVKEARLGNSTVMPILPNLVPSLWSCTA